MMKPPCWVATTYSSWYTWLSVPRWNVHVALVCQPSTTSSQPSTRTILSLDDVGHFQLNARVDGRRLSFMVDTGASVIALTADDAATLGIHPSAREFTALVSTANGTVKAAPIELDRVEIEDITVRNVAAMVLPDGALRDNLLGM